MSVQHTSKMEQMPFRPSALHRLMLHRGTMYVGKRQSLCRTSAFQLSYMDMSIRKSPIQDTHATAMIAGDFLIL